MKVACLRGLTNRLFEETLNTKKKLCFASFININRYTSKTQHKKGTYLGA